MPVLRFLLAEDLLRWRSRSRRAVAGRVLEQAESPGVQLQFGHHLSPSTPAGARGSPTPIRRSAFAVGGYLCQDLPLSFINFVPLRRHAGALQRRLRALSCAAREVARDNREGAPSDAADSVVSTPNAELAHRCSDRARCTPLVLPDRAVETPSPNVQGVSCCLDHLHKARITERSPNGVLHEVVRVDVGLDGVDSETHAKPLTGSNAEIPHSSAKVPFVIARVRPLPEPLLRRQRLLLEEGDEPAEPPDTRPVVVPPEVLRGFAVPLRCVRESIEHCAKLREMSDLVPTMVPVVLDRVVDGHVVHLEVQDRQQDVGDVVVVRTEVVFGVTADRREQRPALGNEALELFVSYRQCIARHELSLAHRAVAGTPEVRTSVGKGPSECAGWLVSSQAGRNNGSRTTRGHGRLSHIGGP